MARKATLPEPIVKVYTKNQVRPHTIRFSVVLPGQGITSLTDIDYKCVKEERGLEGVTFLTFDASQETRQIYEAAWADQCRIAKKQQIEIVEEGSNAKG